jgi:predicted RNA methylase
MSRIETIADGVELHHGDCREILPTLRKVDAVVTDPPYGVLDEAWDDMSERELARFTMSWLGPVAGLSETAIIFFGERTREVVGPMLEAVYDDVRQLIWDKLGGNVAEDKLFYSFESIYFCHPPDTWEVAEPKALTVAAMIREARVAAGLSRGGVDMVVRGKKTGLCFRWEEAACLPTPQQIEKMQSVLCFASGFNDAYQIACKARSEIVERARAETAKRAAGSRDVFQFSPPYKKVHPTEKPVPLLLSLIKLTGDNGAVLDPFMGSGTTGIAAVKLGRSFTGIEADPKYFDLACKRIDEALKQPDLFVIPPAAPAQMGWDDMWTKPLHDTNPEFQK